MNGWRHINVHGVFALHSLLMAIREDPPGYQVLHETGASGYSSPRYLDYLPRTTNNSTI